MNLFKSKYLFVFLLYLAYVPVSKTKLKQMNVLGTAVAKYSRTDKI